MQSEAIEQEKKKSINNYNNIDASAATKDVVASKDDYQNLIENDEDLENNYSDSDESNEEEQFMNSFSSPENSGDELQWYAYRGRLGINFMESNEAPNNQLNNYQLQIENQQPNRVQDDEETDFLEMDFEPDTNSEIENENEARFNYDLINGHNNLPENHLASQDINFNINQQQSSSLNIQSLNENQIAETISKNTGAKPKQFSSCRNLKSPKPNSQHVSDGDNTFKITGHLYNNTESNHNDENSYNIGASCSSRPYYHHHRSSQLDNHFIKLHKSPSKSSSHSNKQQKLHEEQNDQFLFEIEPIKPRNSVTIYTSNCDEKILLDALTSLKLNPDREIILNYFNKSSGSLELGLIDYIIYRSKKNCNYIKLIELIEESCMNDYHDEYGTKKFDINFYPLDFFSTTPEMIDVEVSEIIKRWTPQSDLTPLINIKNKHFIQTNVLGKLVNIIRRFNNSNNQKSSSNIYCENEFIKIPQFYVSGYITVTARQTT